jgi:hypothetical protein
MRFVGRVGCKVDFPSGMYADDQEATVALQIETAVDIDEVVAEVNVLVNDALEHEVRAVCSDENGRHPDCVPASSARTTDVVSVLLEAGAPPESVSSGAGS